jgi:hypothetical protein
VVSGIVSFSLFFYYTISIQIVQQKVTWKTSQDSLCPSPDSEDVLGSGCIDPHFLCLNTSWRRVISLKPWPLYAWGKEPLIPTGEEISWAQSWSGWHGEVQIIDPTGTQTATSWSSSPQQFAILTKPSQLLDSNQASSKYQSVDLPLAQNVSGHHVILQTWPMFWSTLLLPPSKQENAA